MKSRFFQKIALIILIMAVSCDEPETVVTNIIHADGSITRKIEMRNVKNIFKTSDLPVPFDSTWIVKDSIEVNSKGDTTWVKRAEKLFARYEDINSSYLTDSGGNRFLSRHLKLDKKFKWFNTEFRFSEVVEKQLDFGYPVKDFLNSEELAYFYSPSALISENLTGQDSLKYKALRDSVDHKTDLWLTRTFLAGWLNEFGSLTNDSEIKSSLENREKEIFEVISLNLEELDSLWNMGIVLKEFIGESKALRYKVEADSAAEIVADKIFRDFKSYSVSVVMPGNLTSTNGFVDSSKVLLWPVKSDYFFTQPYEMWAVSKVPNTWAWIVSGMFVLFVITGISIRRKR